MTRFSLTLFLLTGYLWNTSYGSKHSELLERILSYSNSDKDLNAEVLKLYRSRDIDDRVVAAVLVGEYSPDIREDTAIPVLKALLKDSSEAVRLESLYTVQRLAESPSFIEIASTTVLKNFVGEVGRLAKSNSRTLRIGAERALRALKRRKLDP